jgi:hypothetical protein
MIKAACFRKSSNSLSRVLRYFFGGPVTPDTLVAVGKNEYEFRYILPPIPIEGLFDDFEACGGKMDSRSGTCACVYVRRTEDGFTVDHTEPEKDVTKTMLDDEKSPESS